MSALTFLVAVAVRAITGTGVKVSVLSSHSSQDMDS